MTVLRRLAKNCEYGELTDSIIKDWIVEGKTMIARGQGYFAEKNSVAAEEYRGV